MGIGDTILTMFDRIAHEDTSDQVRHETLAWLRRELHGQQPSEILKEAGTDTQMAKDEINQLREQLAEAQAKTQLEQDDEISQLRSLLAEKDAQNARLVENINALNARLHPEPVDGHYPLQHFLSVLYQRRGCTYAWREDYCAATKNTPGATIAETTQIHQWQAKERVPEVYVDQINILVFRKRKNDKENVDWSQENYDYLASEYLLDQTQSNRQLAEKCTQQFGRNITENSIRGGLDRLRKQGRISKRRSGRGNQTAGELEKEHC